MQKADNNLSILTQQNLDELQRDWFEERAAIYEFEAGLERQMAEQRAWEELKTLRGKKVIHKAG